MDKVYKSDIPAIRRSLEELTKAFSELTLKTDWNRLRVEPLLNHAKSLQTLLKSRQFERETTRLPKGVKMFHADLVYFRQNIKALKTLLVATEVQKNKRGARGK